MFTIQWYPTGETCEESAVAVCSAAKMDKWLLTQYINKSVPAPDTYPVRVFVDITYSFVPCPEERDCDHDFELHRYVTNFEQPEFNPQLFTDRGIMPDSRIQDRTTSGKQQFYFDLSEDEDGFYLGLKSRRKGVCVTVSRILVFLFECPTTTVAGLARYTATQAPINGTVSSMSECAENAHHTETSKLDTLECTTAGKWQNDQAVCECDLGYLRDGSVCEGKFEDNLTYCMNYWYYDL